MSTDADKLELAEAELLKAIGRKNVIERECSKKYKLVKSLREKRDSAISKVIIDKDDLRLSNQQWAFVLQGDGTDAFYKTQQHVFNKLGVFGGGIWAYDNKNKQAVVTVTRNTDIEAAHKGISMLVKKYKPMVSMFDCSKGKTKKTLGHPPVFYFGLHDTDSCMNGVFYLEVTLDGKRARVLIIKYGDLKVFNDMLTLKEQLQWIRKNVQS